MYFSISMLALAAATFVPSAFASPVDATPVDLTSSTVPARRWENNMAIKAPDFMYQHGNPNCGPINGNCYENGCNGGASPDQRTCTAGQYVGCECGYMCGPELGGCDANGCAGDGGRCQEKYWGCSCMPGM